MENLVNLSNSEKIKLFDVICCLSNANNSSAVSGGESSTSPPKSQLSVLLETLIGEPKKETEDNRNTENISPSAEPRKKQKTLDNWLIRKNDGAESGKNIKKQNTVQVTVAGINTPDKNAVESISASLSYDNDDSSSSHSSFNVCTESTLVNSGGNPKLTNENICIENEKSTIPVTDGTPLCTLRRSKRKLNIEDESTNNVAKSIKMYSGDSVKVPKLNETENELNSKLIYSEIHENKQISECLSLLPEKINCCYSDSNTNANLIKTHKHSGNSENLNIKSYSPINKSSYNLRTKRRIPKRFRDELEMENSVSVKILNEHLMKKSEDHSIENNVNHTIASSSQIGYEAFSKLNKLCRHFNIDINDILQDENISNLLNNYESDSPDDGIILVGTHKSVTGKTHPVIHSHLSESKLIRDLSSMKNKTIDKKKLS